MKRIQLLFKKRPNNLTYTCFLLIYLLFAFNLLSAQVGINNTDPKASLDITATDPSNPENTEGFLAPRVTAFPSTNPGLEQDGMLLYLTATVGLNTPGYYFWNNTAISWLKVADSSISSNWTRTGTNLDVTTTGDDIHFTSDQTSITFPQSSGTPSSMIYMFDGGTSNANRMVLSHSAAFPDWGLEYEDTFDRFIFKNTIDDMLTIDLHSPVPLDVLGGISLGNAGDKYTLPFNNGDPNQIMQTNGSGIVSWVDASSIGDHDFYEEGTTTAPNSINDDIFTLGNVAIGKNTADYALDVYSNSSIRGINNVLNGGALNGSLFGIYNYTYSQGIGQLNGLTNEMPNNSNRGNKVGVHNNITNNRFFGQNYQAIGILNSMAGVSDGDVKGTYNLITQTGNGDHFGTLNKIFGSGTGERYGSKNIIDIAA